MNNYKQGDLIKKTNKRTGYVDKEVFKLVTDFKNERKYADFLAKMYVERFSLFMAYTVATNMLLNSDDCPLSELDKAKNTAVIQTLVAMFHARDKEHMSEESKAHREYEESLFAYLDAHGRKSKQ